MAMAQIRDTSLGEMEAGRKPAHIVLLSLVPCLDIISVAKLTVTSAKSKTLSACSPINLIVAKGSGTSC